MGAKCWTTQRRYDLSLELAVGEVQAAGRRLFAGFVKDVSARQQSEHRLQELQSELIQVARLSAMGEVGFGPCA